MEPPFTQAPAARPLVRGQLSEQRPDPASSQPGNLVPTLTGPSVSRSIGHTVGVPADLLPHVREGVETSSGVRAISTTFSTSSTSSRSRASTSIDAAARRPLCHVVEAALPTAKYSRHPQPGRGRPGLAPRDEERGGRTLARQIKATGLVASPSVAPGGGLAPAPSRDDIECADPDHGPEKAVNHSSGVGLSQRPPGERSEPPRGHRHLARCRRPWRARSALRCRIPATARRGTGTAAAATS